MLNNRLSRCCAVRPTTTPYRPLHSRRLRSQRPHHLHLHARRQRHAGAPLHHIGHAVEQVGADGLHDEHARCAEAEKEAEESLGE